MGNAIPERRGDYDLGRQHDSLIYRTNGLRAAMFINEVGDIGCSVAMPDGSALAYSVDPLDLIHFLRWRLRRGADLERKPSQCVECDCTTSIHADGTRRTYCSSDQMMRAIADGTVGVWEGHVESFCEQTPPPSREKGEGEK
jgi:hypothetical protein